MLGRLEATQHGLRDELEELRSTIERHAAHTVEIEATRDRLLAERDLGVTEARSLLAEARALRVTLAGDGGG